MITAIGTAIRPAIVAGISIAGDGLSLSLDAQFAAFMASLAGPRALFDPSRASSRFQDAAASTLVTADGQPFARLNDSSGAGNHVSQSVAASMPLYRTDGALHWAQFDGSDDFWQSLANLDMSGTDKVTVVAGVKVAAAAGDQLRVVELGANAATTAGCFALESNIQSNAQFRGELFGSSRGVVDTPVTTFGVGKVVTAAYDIAPTSVLDEIKIWVNGEVSNSPTLASAGTGNLGNFPLTIARRGAGGAFFNGLIYALLIIGRLLTAAELSLCRRWMASKTGVVLP